MQKNTTISSSDKTFELTRLDARSIGACEEDVRLFLVERNEVTRLPYLLRYYRNLGVSKFFIVDDKSNDGSREYLMKQQDCYLFEPSNSFKESRAGVDWQNLLLNQFGIGSWTIVTDADELLVYPHMDKIKLPEFCKYLEGEGSTALFAFLLDMYPKNDLSTGICIPDKPFYEICPYFDSEYKFRHISTIHSAINELPRIRVVGGPRFRKFYPMQKNIDFLHRMLNTVTIKIADKFTFIKGDRPHYAPALIKVPLVKWASNIKRLSNHIILAPPNTKISLITGAIMHFKFFADFHEKAKNEVVRGVHFGGSLEYKRYLAHTKKNPNMKLYYRGSKKFEGADSLIAADLIHSSDNFESYVVSKSISPKKSLD